MTRPSSLVLDCKLACSRHRHQSHRIAEGGSTQEPSGKATSAWSVRGAGGGPGEIAAASMTALVIALNRIAEGGSTHGSANPTGLPPPAVSVNIQADQSNQPINQFTAS